MVYIPVYVKTVRYLNKLGMNLFRKEGDYEVYRMDIKGHILTVHLRVDGDDTQPDMLTFLNIDKKNIWWHKHEHNSGYTVQDYSDFIKDDFKYLIMSNSIFYKTMWKDI